MMMMTCYKTSDAYMLHVLLHTFNGNNNNEINANNEGRK